MTQLSLDIKRKILLYIPIYNCKKTIILVLNSIPKSTLEISTILIVDNGSTDDSVNVVKEWINSLNISFINAILIQTTSNLGYAGSQKLAYSIANLSESVDWVIMLHGDAQYDASLTKDLIGHINSEANAIYGYRTKTKYWRKDETPPLTWASIKFLNIIESLITGIKLKEWHTGFIMYSNKFLKQLNYDVLTDTPHLDGQILSISQTSPGGAIGIPIYKRYENLEQFSGLARVRYITSVFKLMPIIKNMNKNKSYFRDNPLNLSKVNGKFSLLASRDSE
jgi:glycosyltransferase involved in cell wall biosynthesis